MHVFLTGDIRIGKSTVIQKVITALRCPIGGFETYFMADRNRIDSRLYMGRAGDPHVAETKREVARFCQGSSLAYPDRFDAIGCALLKEAKRSASLLIMDECGRLEKDALLFQQAVLQALDDALPVLGVVRQNAAGFPTLVSSHPGVQLIHVTEANRDQLPEQIIRHFQSIGIEAKLGIEAK